MENKREFVKLTSSEIALLWTTYTNDSIVSCLITHFIETAEDPEVVEILKQALNIAEAHMHSVKSLFENEGIAIPLAFPIEQHVVPHAPRLFSDVMYAELLKHICSFGLASHMSGVATAPREDVRTLYEQFFNDASSLNNRVIETMKSKGILIRMPNMEYPKHVEMLHNQHFLAGWLGRQRTLMAIEVTHLTACSLHNVMGKHLCMAFAQVTDDADLRKYFLRGKKVSTDIVRDIHDILVESDVPIPSTWDATISTSTAAPFSNQLMMVLIGTMSNLGISSYGVGLSTSMRRDLGALYADFIRKASFYGEDGMNIMISREWIEQPPTFVDHEAL
ncbi:DUF3231 family protein [Mesobacillus thioparans]|uniref:DUF3231 family protein n=1 Tax=Mesobacillus thioparans TaxID=370439 RepID=UPI0039F02854